MHSGADPAGRRRRCRVACYGSQMQLRTARRWLPKRPRRVSHLARPGGSGLVRRSPAHRATAKPIDVPAAGPLAARTGAQRKPRRRHPSSRRSAPHLRYRPPRPRRCPLDRSQHVPSRLPAGTAAAAGRAARLGPSAADPRPTCAAGRQLTACRLARNAPRRPRRVRSRSRCIEARPRTSSPTRCRPGRSPTMATSTCRRAPDRWDRQRRDAWSLTR